MPGTANFWDNRGTVERPPATASKKETHSVNGIAVIACLFLLGAGIMYIIRGHNVRKKAAKDDPSGPGNAGVVGMGLGGSLIVLGAIGLTAAIGWAFVPRTE